MQRLQSRPSVLQFIWSQRTSHFDYKLLRESASSKSLLKVFKSATGYILNAKPDLNSPLHGQVSLTKYYSHAAIRAHSQ